jgi:tetratricopeptide (TPR) repeat protein
LLFLYIALDIMRRIQLILISVFLSTNALAENAAILDSLSSKMVTMFGSNKDSTIIIAQELIKESKKANSTYHLVKAYYYIGYIEKVNKGNPYKGLINYLEATKYYELDPDSKATYDVASIYENLGRNFTDYGQLETALDFFAKSYNRYSEIEDLKGQTDVLVYQAETYAKLQDTTTAFQLIDSAIFKARKQSPEKLTTLYNSAGITSLNFKSYKRAILYFKNTIKYAQMTDEGSKNRISYTAYGLHNLGNTKTFTKEYDESEKLLRSALTVYQQNESLFVSRDFFNIYFDMGELFFQSSSYDSAIHYFKIAHQFTKEYDVSTDKDRFRMYQMAAEASEQIEDLKMTIEFNNLYQSYLEQYLARKEAAQIENERLNFDLITQRYFSEIDPSLSVEAKMYWLGGVASLIILTLVGFIGRSAYKKQQLRRLLEYDINRIRNN